MTQPFIGIDFGTSKSIAAWLNPETGRAEALFNLEGEQKTPSVVYFGEEVLVGTPALHMLEVPEERGKVVGSIKRGLSSARVIPAGGRRLRPVEIAAEILKKLKRDAEETHFYGPVTRAVLTCPALFEELQRSRLEEAARLAGFEEVQLLAEPVAAALACARQGVKLGKNVLVYDLGAGTFDLALLTRDEAAGAYRVALEPGGVTTGGDDFDQVLYDLCEESALERLGRGISADERLDLKFLMECRRRKENLSRLPRCEFTSLLPDPERGTVSFRHTVDRSTFEERIASFIEPTVRATRKLVEEGRARGMEVETVLLIGGSSQAPLVQRLLTEALPVPPQPTQYRDMAVALGAAYRAEELWGARREPVSPPQPTLPVVPPLVAVPRAAPQHPPVVVGPRPGEVRVNEIDGAEMVYVPPGEFLMGSEDYRDEKPPHRVRITKGFWLYKTPVTNAQYRKFLQATRYGEPGFWKDARFNAPEQPVVGVSWNDAVAYCRWAGCRLPTEAEWEYAARGTDGRKYPWGNQEPDASRAVYAQDPNVGRPAPAGGQSLGKSPFGALDLAGNVWEWCADWYAVDYYRKSTPQDAPGPPTGTARVLRGGSWLRSANFLRAANRNCFTPETSNHYIGFRPARSS